MHAGTGQERGQRRITSRESAAWGQHCPSTPNLAGGCSHSCGVGTGGGYCRCRCRGRPGAPAGPGRRHPGGQQASCVAAFAVFTGQQGWSHGTVPCVAVHMVPALWSASISSPTSIPRHPPPCRQRQTELARRAAQEQAADENIVQAGLQAAAAAEAQERAAREARRAATVAYREEVVAQMEREQADSAARDAQLSAATEAQQAKRDAEQAARDAARRRLMQDVCATREQQLAAKQAARAAEAEASLRQGLAAEAEAQREAEAAEARRQLERQQQLQQRHDLQARQGHGLGVVHVLFGVARLLTHLSTTCKHLDRNRLQTEPSVASRPFLVHLPLHAGPDERQGAAPCGPGGGGACGCGGGAPGGADAQPACAGGAEAGRPAAVAWPAQARVVIGVQEGELAAAVQLILRKE